MSGSLTLRVAEWRRVTPRARLLELDLDGKRFTHRAGQAAWVGRHGQPLRKHYSFASPPHDVAEKGRLQLLVLLNGAGSPGRHLLRMKPGVLVDMGPPRGRFVFPDNPPERRFLFVAGGTGIAPLRSMLSHARRTMPDARLSLAYSARTPDDFAFSDVFREMADHGALRLVETVTRSGPSAWSGLRGRITREQLGRLLDDPARTRCFVCGPPAMADAAPAILQDLGVPAGLIHREEWDEE